MINAVDVLIRCRDLKRKEAQRAIKQRKLTALTFILLVSGASVASSLNKPEVIMPEPCNMSEYYLTELEDKDEQRVQAITKLKQATAEIRRLKKEKLATMPSKAKTPQILDASRFKMPAFNKINAFDYAVNKTLRHEGGYGIDNNGYPVNYGINQAFYTPLKGYPQRVKHLTKSQAIRYYRVKYWNPLNLDNADYSTEYKALIFDTAVNKGISTAVKINNKANGSIVKAKLLRLAHLKRWAKSGNTGTCGKGCLVSLERRVNSFGGIV